MTTAAEHNEFAYLSDDELQEEIDHVHEEINVHVAYAAQLECLAERRRCESAYREAMTDKYRDDPIRLATVLERNGLPLRARALP